MLRAPSVLVFLVAACRTAAPAGGFTDLAGPTTETVSSARGPKAYAETETTVWEYLANKYDRDRDDVITTLEYGRGETSFKRLDRNKDGRLTGEDFEGGGMFSPERRNLSLAQRSLLRYFQNDDEPGDLSLEELRATFAAVDGNGDGRITLEELEARKEAVDAGAPEAMKSRIPPAKRLHRALLFVTGEEGGVTLAKLEGFFHARDGNKDGVWVQQSRRGGGGRAASGPEPGSVAPDFTLRPPEGGRAVTLSSYAGRRPVALIFGSYT